MQKSKTQKGILGLLESIIRKYTLIYYFSRKIIIKFNIFEDDFKILRKIFKKKRINIIDIGASDGIAANYFIKNLNVNKIYCFEPHKYFLLKLKKLKKKFSNIIIYNHGIGKKNESLKVFIPYIKFFKQNLEILTYTFYDKKELTKQLKLDFINSEKIFIKNTKLKLKKYKIIKNKIDLIKIDVNGYELEIVKSIINQIKKDKPVLIIENNTQIKKITSLLKKYRFEPYYNCNDKLVKFSNQKTLDIIFIAT